MSREEEAWARVMAANAVPVSEYEIAETRKESDRRALAAHIRNRLPKAV